MGDCIFTKNRFLDKDGYPRAKYQGRMQGVHRIMYRLVNGADSIPEGSVIGHLCNNKGCVNPSHLYLTTVKGNSSDAVRDRLYRTGEEAGRAHISDEQVVEIRDLYRTGGYSQAYLAQKYGCSQSQVSMYTRGKRRSKTGCLIAEDER